MAEFKEDTFEIECQGKVKIEYLRNITVNLSRATLSALSGDEDLLEDVDAYTLYGEVRADIYAQNADDEKTLNSVNRLFAENKIDMCTCDYYLE